MPVNRFLVPALTLVILLGTVLGAQAAGLWRTDGKITVTAGSLKSSDIKGWMTLQQAIDGLGMPQPELYALAKIPADVPASTAFKDLEARVPDFSLSTLRDILAAREQTGGEAQAAAPNPAPATAPVEMITLVPAATPSAIPGGAHPSVTSTPLPAGQVLPANQIKGKMTLREVSTQCDVPLGALLATLRLGENTNPDSPIKDLVGNGSVADVSVVQQAVAGLQAR